MLGSTRMPWSEIRFYMEHLGKVEKWLITSMKDPNKITKAVESVDVTDSCVYVAENLDGVMRYGMVLDKQITTVVGMLNTFVRAFATDRSGIITSQESFQLMCGKFLEFLLGLQVSISEDDESEGKSPDRVNLSTTKLEKRDRARYATMIFDSLLTNFAQNDYMKKCLESHFPSKVPSVTGSVTTNGQRSTTDRYGAREFLTQIIEYTGKFAPQTIIPSMDQFSEKYESLMKDLCIFLDEFFANINDLSADDSYMGIIHSILSIVWNLADKTPLIPMLVAADYAEKSVRWIETLSTRNDETSLNEPLIAIIQNLSRHKEGLEALRERDAFQTLMKCKPSLGLEDGIEFGGLVQSFGMSLIALSTSDKELATSDEDQGNNTQLILSVCYKLYFMCKKADPCSNEQLRYKGFHLSELLNSLDEAFSNTYVIRYILGDKEVKPDRIKFFAELLVSLYGSLLNPEADYLEKIMGKSLLNILLYISNYEEYRAELIKHDQFLVLVEGLSKRSEQNIAKRIWCSLDLMRNPEELASRFKVKKQPMVFVSYSWNLKDMRVCRSFVNELNELTDIPLWVDFEKLGWFEDSWDDISLAINHAVGIIVLVSSAYCDNPINFHELAYAVALSQARPQGERSFFIFVDIENGTAEKREWINKLIRTLRQENDIISFDGDEQKMALQVIEQNSFFKNKRLTGTVVQSRVCTIT